MAHYIEVKATVKGNSCLSWSKKIPKTPARTDHRQWEEKTWKQRLHTNAEGEVMIPAMALKHALTAAAQYSGLTIPGGGKRTYTKLFTSAVIPEGYGEAGTGVHIDDVSSEWRFVPSSGKTGDGSRVDKCFPLIDPGWEATFEFQVVDDRITKDVFIRFLQDAGLLIGLGRFRPQNGGFYGRFFIEKIEWKKVSLDNLKAA